MRFDYIRDVLDEIAEEDFIDSITLKAEYSTIPYAGMNRPIVVAAQVEMIDGRVNDYIVVETNAEPERGREVTDRVPTAVDIVLENGANALILELERCQSMDDEDEEDVDDEEFE